MCACVGIGDGYVWVCCGEKRGWNFEQSIEAGGLFLTRSNRGEPMRGDATRDPVLL